MALAALGLLLAGMTGKHADADTADAVGASASRVAASVAARPAAPAAPLAPAASSTAAASSTVAPDAPSTASHGTPSSASRATSGAPAPSSASRSASGAPAPADPTPATSSPTDLAVLAAFGEATFSLADATAAATLIDVPGGTLDDDLAAAFSADFAAAFDASFTHPRATEESMKTVRKVEPVALDDWQARLINLLADAGLCEPHATPTHELPPVAEGPRLPSCVGAFGSLLASLDPAAGGALELVALRRTAEVPVDPQQLLIAAFELGYWRPADLHPSAAAIYRWVAAGVRHSAVQLPFSALDAVGVAPPSGRGRCELSALALAGEMAHRYPRITKVWRGAAINDGLDLPLAATARTVAAGLCWSSGLNRWQLTPAGSAALTWTADLPYRSCDAIVDTPATEDDLAPVGGTLVHRCLATTTAALLRAADAHGVLLTPSGWRSLWAQLWLRQANCPLPPPDDPGYQRALWGMPQEACSPPTAIPRQSRHQSGVALDFSCGPQHDSLTRPDSPCLAWLDANAHRFGLYNLPSEPWHWSTDGL